jgi:hypothetical protein
MPRTALRMMAVTTTAPLLTGAPAIEASAYQPSQQDLYVATNPAGCNKNPCILYPKSAQLPSGRLVAGFEDSEGPVDGQALPIFKSDDDGTSWQKLGEVAPPSELSDDPTYAGYTSNWTNPYFYVMPSDVGPITKGTLLLADVVSGPGDAPGTDGNDRRNMAIVLYASVDEGRSWTVLDTIATGHAWDDPVWEPYLMVHDGKLVAYYSDENDYLGFDSATGIPVLDPANRTAPDSGGQVLVHKTWDGTGTWSQPVLDVAGFTQDMGGGKTEIGGGRPGMTNIVPTTDGKWFLTYEYWGGGDNINYKVADDPLKFYNANGAVGLGISNIPVSSSHRLAQGGSPVTIALPDGRLVYNAAGSGNVWVNASGRSDGVWKEYQTPVAAGYSRNLQYVKGTGRIEILQAAWAGAATGPVHFGEVDLGYSTGAYYTIVNRKTGQVLSTDADKTQDANLTGDRPDIISWADNPANDTQRWHIVQKGSDVTFLNKAGGRSIATWTGNAVPGQRLTQWVDDDATDKRWTLVPTSDGFYKVKSVRNPNLYMTSGGPWAAPIDLQPGMASSDDDAQEWQFVVQDATPPAVSGTLSPQGDNGWVNDNPQLTVTAADDTGVQSVQYKLGDGAWQTYTGPVTLEDGTYGISLRATDIAGKVGTAELAAKVDGTDPGLSWTNAVADNAHFVFGQVPESPSCTSTDAGSGPDSCQVAGYSTAVGTHTLTATARDVAGNTTTKAITYSVDAWTISGFYHPVDKGDTVNTVKGGSTVPLTFEAFAGSTEIIDPAAVKMTAAKITCDSGAVTDEIEILAAGNTAFRYDTDTGTFLYNWKAPKDAGACYRVTATTTDGSAISAKFRLR